MPNQQYIVCNFLSALLICEWLEKKDEWNKAIILEAPLLVGPIYKN
jgi:hypothetical protein